jgi:hypothetical protein
LRPKSGQSNAQSGPGTRPYVKKFNKNFTQFNHLSQATGVKGKRTKNAQFAPNSCLFPLAIFAHPETVMR